jgi:hypothetical protein
VKNNEGCRVVGKIKLHKVPSTIFVTTESNQWIINNLIRGNPELGNRISLIHYFNKYTFLNAEGVDLADLKARFSEHPEHLNFDLSPKEISAADLADKNIYNYFKF